LPKKHPCNKECCFRRAFWLEKYLESADKFHEVNKRRIYIGGRGTLSSPHISHVLIPEDFEGPSEGVGRV
jgi:hypothetical protein